MLRSVVLAILLLAPTGALAAHIAPGEAKTLQAYTLTMPKVRAYDAASRALNAAIAKDASLRKEAEAAASENSKNLADEFAKLGRHPRVFAFYQKLGLSAQDAILIPLTLLDACMAVQYPAAAKSLADRTSPAQIAFCKQNLATIKTMSLFQHG
jgi:hypothetical protein